MAIRLVPTAIAGGVGIAHTVMLSTIKPGPTPFDGLGTLMLVTVGPLAAGIALDLFRFNPDITEGLMFSGAALTGQLGGVALGIRGRRAGATSPSILAVATPLDFPTVAASPAPALRQSEKRPVVLG